MSTAHRTVIMHSQLGMPPRECPMYIDAGAFRVIMLYTQHRFWCQYMYQFAHEYVHLLTGRVWLPMADGYGWVEEILCETASMFQLNQAPAKWNISPPYPSWSVYSASIKEYADGRIDPIPVPDTTYATWLAPQLARLAGDRYDRDTNAILAKGILPVFMEDPQAWHVVPYLSGMDYAAFPIFADFLTEWERRAGVTHGPFVSKIGSILSN